MEKLIELAQKYREEGNYVGCHYLEVAIKLLKEGQE